MKPDYEWDENKRRENWDKHELDFDDVRTLDWANATIIASDRRGEERFAAFAYMGPRLYVVIFTLRGNAIRIISFRVASSNEVSQYG